LGGKGAKGVWGRIWGNGTIRFRIGKQASQRGKKNKAAPNEKFKCPRLENESEKGKQDRAGRGKSKGRLERNQKIYSTNAGQIKKKVNIDGKGIGTEVGIDGRRQITEL